MATIQKRDTKSGARYTVTVRRAEGSESKTFTSRKAAKEWAAAKETDLRRGHDAIITGKRTLQEALDAYRDVLRAKPRGLARDRERLIAWWEREYGTRDLKSITRAELLELRARLAKAGRRSTKAEAAPGLAASTTNAMLSALRSALGIAVARGWLVRNVASDAGVMEEGARLRRRPPRGRIRYLSDAERGRLMAACREHPERALYPLVLLALATGARAGELLHLEWQDVDLERGALTLRKTKTDEVRGVPVTGPALELLKGLHATAKRAPPGRDFVIRANSGAGGAAFNYRRPWLEAVKAAKLDAPLRFHDLRHTAASYAVQSGLSLPVVGALLGHKTPSMTMRYAHLSPAHLDAVAAVLAQKITETPTPTQEPTP